MESEELNLFFAGTIIENLLLPPASCLLLLLLLRLLRLLRLLHLMRLLRLRVCLLLLLELNKCWRSSL